MVNNSLFQNTSDLMTMNLLDPLAECFNKPKGDDQSMNYLSNSIGGSSNFAPVSESKQATDFLSVLRSIQENKNQSQNQSADPFLMLREALDVQTFAQGGSNADVQKQKLMNSSLQSNEMPFGIKNQELFAKAQLRAGEAKKTDWFSRMQGGSSLNEKSSVIQDSKIEANLQCGLTKEQEIQIGLDMIPMFKAKEEDLLVCQDKIKGVRQELKAFQKENGIKLRYVQPQHTTHFMNRKASVNEVAKPPTDYLTQNKQAVRTSSSSYSVRPATGTKASQVANVVNSKYKDRSAAIQRKQDISGPDIELERSAPISTSVTIQKNANDEQDHQTQPSLTLQEIKTQNQKRLILDKQKSTTIKQSSVKDKLLNGQKESITSIHETQQRSKSPLPIDQLIQNKSPTPPPINGVDSKTGFGSKAASFCKKGSNTVIPPIQQPGTFMSRRLNGGSVAPTGSSNKISNLQSQPYDKQSAMVLGSNPLTDSQQALTCQAGGGTISDSLHGSQTNLLLSKQPSHTNRLPLCAASVEQKVSPMRHRTAGNGAVRSTIANLIQENAKLNSAVIRKNQQTNEQDRSERTQSTSRAATQESQILRSTNLRITNTKITNANQQINTALQKVEKAQDLPNPDKQEKIHKFIIQENKMMNSDKCSDKKTDLCYKSNRDDSVEQSAQDSTPEVIGSRRIQRLKKEKDAATTKTRMNQKLNEMSFNNNKNQNLACTNNGKGVATADGRRTNQNRVSKRDMTELIYVEACNLPNSVESVRTSCNTRSATQKLRDISTKNAPASATYKLSQTINSKVKSTQCKKQKKNQNNNQFNLDIGSMPSVGSGDDTQRTSEQMPSIVKSNNFKITTNDQKQTRNASSNSNSHQIERQEQLDDVNLQNQFPFPQDSVIAFMQTRSQISQRKTNNPITQSNEKESLKNDVFAKNKVNQQRDNSKEVETRSDLEISSARRSQDKSPFRSNYLQNHNIKQRVGTSKDFNLKLNTQKLKSIDSNENGNKQPSQRTYRRKQLSELEAIIIESQTNPNFAQKSCEPKKNKKGWRFAYDMYCRELLMGNQVSAREEVSSLETQTKTGTNNTLLATVSNGVPTQVNSLAMPSNRIHRLRSSKTRKSYHEFKTNPSAINQAPLETQPGQTRAVISSLAQNNNKVKSKRNLTNRQQIRVPQIIQQKKKDLAKKVDEKDQKLGPLSADLESILQNQNNEDLKKDEILITEPILALQDEQSHLNLTETASFRQNNDSLQTHTHEDCHKPVQIKDAEINTINCNKRGTMEVIKQSDYQAQTTSKIEDQQNIKQVLQNQNQVSTSIHGRYENQEGQKISCEQMLRDSLKHSISFNRSSISVKDLNNQNKSAQRNLSQNQNRAETNNSKTALRQANASKLSAQNSQSKLNGSKVSKLNKAYRYSEFANGTTALPADLIEIERLYNQENNDSKSPTRFKQRLGNESCFDTINPSAYKNTSLEQQLRKQASSELRVSNGRPRSSFNNNISKNTSQQPQRDQNTNQNTSNCEGNCQYGHQSFMNLRNQQQNEIRVHSACSRTIDVNEYSNKQFTNKSRKQSNQSNDLNQSVSQNRLNEQSIECIKKNSVPPVSSPSYRKSKVIATVPAVPGSSLEEAMRARSQKINQQQNRNTNHQQAMLINEQLSNDSQIH